MKKTVLVSLVLILIICLSGCGEKENFEKFMESLRLNNGNTLETSTNDAWVYETENLEDLDAESTEKIQDETEIMHEAYQTIMQKYAIDTFFLNWVSTQYGGECIVEIARQVDEGNEDTDIWHEQTGNTLNVLKLMYGKAYGLDQYRLENVKWQECASEDEITLAFAGDINFSEGYVTTKHLDRTENGIQDCFSEDLLALMNSMDIMMINNEFTYSTRGKALAGKAYTFRADPSRVELLNAFGTDIVSLANNHVYDFGPDALLDTVATLDEAGIPSIGAGANIKEAGEPYYFVCNGRKIAIVAATQIERSLNYTKEATEDSPGVLKTLNPEKFVKVIEDVRKNSDYVIAFVHWGTEGDSNYGKDQEELARAFVEAGVDAIIGGHTHCLQGFEIMDGVPIIYSLGNFWFGSKTQDTGIAKVTIDAKGELHLSFIPCIQQNIRTYLVTEEGQKKRILNFMQEHSAKGACVTPEGEVKEEQILQTLTSE